MAIVCRPLHLYNEFLPAEIKTGREWEYQAFGHHDGISIGKRILLNDAGSFEYLFDYSVKYEMEESYFNQIVWGIHEDVEREKAFWEQEDYPFLYLVLLQVAGEENSYQKIKKQLDLGYCEKNDEKVSVLFYYSIDNSDLIMAVRSKRADLGFEVVNKLHYDMNECSFKIRNTYSILGVLKKAIDEINMIPQDEKIALLELQIIEKEKGSLNALYNELIQKIRDGHNKIFRKVILGTKDDAIFIRDISWRELLPFYKKETGILNNSNSNTQKYTFAISSHIMMKEEQGTGEFDVKEPEPVEAPFCDKLKAIIKEKTENENSFRPEIKNLLVLINAFRRFEYQNDKDRPFTDYTFFPLFLPFYQFVKIVNVQEEGFSKYYYHFMKCMKICTQNFTKPERIYSQITDFNIRYFDMPVKLITLYNAYIYSIKKLLNVRGTETTTPSYEFMICAGLNDKTEVKELFMRQEYNRRLFLIETPERQMYQIRLMFYVLGHEVAHFVGTAIRNRDGRMRQILKVCGRAISLSMKSYYEYGEKSSAQEYSTKWIEVERKLIEWIHFYMKRSLNPEYLRQVDFYDCDIVTDETVNESIEFYVMYASHSDILQIVLLNTIKEMLSSKGANVFSFIIAEEYENKDNADENKRSWNDFYQVKKDSLKNYIDSFIGISVNSDMSLTIDNIVDKTLFWMKECYADIICILMLRISLKDYINSFVSVLSVQSVNVEKLCCQDLVIRIALVMAAMTYPMEHTKAYRWTDDEYADYETWDDHCKKIQEAANLFIQSYILNKKEFESEELIKNSFKIFCDQTILIGIMQYLVECIMLFTEEVEIKNEKAGILEQVRSFYKMSEIKESNNFFDNMMLFLKRYEKNVYTEMKEAITEEV